MAGHHVGVQVQGKISLRTAYRCPKYDIIPCAKNQRTFTTLTPPHPILFHPTLTLPHSTPYPIPPHPTALTRDVSKQLELQGNAFPSRK